ncbi:hypothetical protein HYH03_014824 [Edaphochlamys debaryana]|uniref:Uncharacterized protein n=1 Tax=Edaphochlamys debaryana TaxID=47281 RepID=A0A836BRV9_9CHLO|nr:hypothetical protein HYH03_014824 [Edaphochlamys debaryana]|eukprot:KAG2486522.1 hypothetical protein HYH03_014824 [Edaphochlamys debaryana]
MGILAGRDLESGGTWLGVSPSAGRVCFLTNLRALDPVEPPSCKPARLNGQRHASRGELPLRFLRGGESPAAFAQSLRADAYHGFNLVAVDLVRGQLVYTNNERRSGAEAEGAAGAGQPVLGVVAGHAGAEGPGRGGAGAGVEARAGAKQHVPVQGSCKGSETEANGAAGHGVNGNGAAGGSTGAGGAGESCSCRVEQLQRGRVYGLSNGRLGEWPKVATGVELLEGMLKEEEISNEGPVPWDRLFEDLLGDSRRLVPAPPPPDETASAGSPTAATAAAAVEFERQLEHLTSGRFVSEVPSPYGPYGTRAQTVILVRRNGSAVIRERHLHEDGVWRQQEQVFSIALQEEE